MVLNVINCWILKVHYIALVIFHDLHSPIGLPSLNYLIETKELETPKEAKDRATCLTSPELGASASLIPMPNT